MRIPFKALRFATMRTCQNLLVTRPCASATVSIIAISRRSMTSAADAESTTMGPHRAREYEYGEEDDQARPWVFNDITSLAHGELEQHREVRHYARIAAYEMPRLAQLATPFVPPTDGQPLRFRYTTYMGEDHPAESKVVLEFSPLDLPLSNIERNKLIKLVGPRFNPNKSIVKMSCEMFQHQAQNKKYLSDLVDKLLVEAKDPTDTFEDVPFDFRHHKVKAPQPKFPMSWVLIAKKKTYERELKEIQP